METVAVILMAAAAAAFVLAPLMRADALEEDRSRAVPAEIADLLAEREMVLAGLRDLEDDRETGKLSEEDYREMRATLSARAIEILKRLEEVEAGAGHRRTDATDGGRRPDEPAAERAR